MKISGKNSVWAVLFVTIYASIIYGQTPETIPAIRSPLLRVDYQLETPACELDHVELWYARGLDAPWQQYKLENALPSALIFDTENQEGVYRFYVVAADRLGRYSNPLFKIGAKPEELPPHLPGESMVLVDFTPPALVLSAPVGQVTQFRESPVLIKWAGTDNHLGEKPVTIAYQQEGAVSWKNLAPPQPAVGQFTWPCPVPMASRFRVKLAIVDQAGNRTARISDWVKLLERPLNPAQQKPVPAAMPRIAAAQEEPNQPTPEHRRRLEECFRRGQLYCQQQQWQQAIYAFQEVLDDEPNRVETRVNLATAWYRMGKFDQARTEFELCRQERPDSAGILYNLGQTQIALAQFEPARVTLRRLLELNPRDWEAWVLYGDAWAGLNEMDLARKCWVQAASGSVPGAVRLAQSRLERHAH